MPSPPLEHLTALAARFRGLGMGAHLELLRAYWRARQRSRKAMWNDAMVLHWLRVLRVPPHDTYFRVQGRNTPCADCAARGEASGSYTLLTFPEGSLSTCHKCRSEWLELHG